MLTCVHFFKLLIFFHTIDLLPKGMVRKRVLPFLRESLQPLCCSDSADFETVDNSVVDSVEGANPISGRPGLVTDTGSIFISKRTDSTTESEPNLNVGEIIGVTPDGNVCCALVRLENILPQNAKDKLPGFDCSFSSVATGNVDLPLTEETREISTASAIGAFFSVIPIRPPFWIERDPITNRRLDTHED